MTKAKKILVTAALIGACALPLAAAAATTMMGGSPGYGMMGNVNAAVTAEDKAQTAKDEAAGKAIWDELQAKSTDCASLSDDDFDVLGDYFMGLMSGDAHAAMNANMAVMMGADGEKQMHIVLGKRLSGCETGATLPAASYGSAWRYPIAMAGPWGIDATSSPRPDVNWPLWVYVGLTMVLVWVTLVLAIIALVKWIIKQK